MLHHPAILKTFFISTSEIVNTENPHLDEPRPEKKMSKSKRDDYTTDSTNEVFQIIGHPLSSSAEPFQPSDHILRKRWLHFVTFVPSEYQEGGFTLDDWQHTRVRQFLQGKKSLDSDNLAVARPGERAILSRCPVSQCQLALR